MKEAYDILLPRIRNIAREAGYAVGVHGSGERDLDIIAVPWIQEAEIPASLIQRLVVGIDGFIIEGDPARNPTKKPHGRLGWSIHIGNRLYIDVSVMPLRGAE